MDQKTENPPAVDPAVKVQENPSDPSQFGVWHISQNLTDRWGELNKYDAEHKPFDGLLANETLLQELVHQFFDELCFVVRKDGEYGILFEVEYCSQESEAENPGQLDLKPHSTVVSKLLTGIKQLRERFPGVPMCVPDKTQMVEERPGVWAFVKNRQLSGAERRELGLGLLDLLREPADA